jgi:Rrf2 family cysteine metabolism transcriptional repressor
MRISKKCRYALRAIFELALRNRGRPVKIHEIAAAQNIPPRFLEVILNELRHAGFVDSRRGNGGGYVLTRDAKDLTVGEVIEYIQGSISVASDGIRKAGRNTVFFGDDAFEQLWRELNTAISEACDSKTFAELVEFERAKRETCVPDYSI